MDQEDAEFRYRFRLIPYRPSPAPRNAPYASTPHDVEKAPRNPTTGRLAFEVMFPTGSPHMPPGTSFIRSPFEGIPPVHTFARGSKNPVTLALGASGTTKGPTREVRMLNGARGLVTPADRQAENGPRRLRVGVRLRPFARGEGANGMQIPPPAIHTAPPACRPPLIQFVISWTRLLWLAKWDMPRP